MRNQPSGIASAVASGLAPVALHHVLAADRDLADLARPARRCRRRRPGASRRPRSGVPIEPGLRSRVRLVERRDRRGLGQAVALEDDAAERLLERAHHLDRHRRAAGDAQPQARHVVACASVGWCSIAAYIVGTPSKIVTLSRSMTSSALPASNRGIRVRQAPASTAALSAQVSPKHVEQRQAAHDHVVGACSRAGSRAVVRGVADQLAWVSSAPLGWPVVPEV